MKFLAIASLLATFLAYCKPESTREQEVRSPTAYDSCKNCRAFRIENFSVFNSVGRVKFDLELENEESMPLLIDVSNWTTVCLDSTLAYKSYVGYHGVQNVIEIGVNSLPLGFRSSQEPTEISAPPPTDVRFLEIPAKSKIGVTIVLNADSITRKLLDRATYIELYGGLWEVDSVRKRYVWYSGRSSYEIALETHKSAKCPPPTFASIHLNTILCAHSN